jgi:hypothetical protein
VAGGVKLDKATLRTAARQGRRNGMVASMGWSDGGRTHDATIADFNYSFNTILSLLECRDLSVYIARKFCRIFLPDSVNTDSG